MPKFKTVEVEFEGLTGVKVPVIPNLAQLILEQVQKEPKRFDMGSWHCKVGEVDDDCSESVPPQDYKKCGTDHCVAGWAIAIAGKAGIDLERKTYTDDAAQLMFQRSALGEDFPSFYGSNEDALRDLKDFARREADVLASMALDGKWNYGADKQTIHSQLAALNPETATVKEVEAVIGNSSWTGLNCSCCDRACEAVVRVGDEPDFESETADLCLSCVGDAVKAFAGRFSR